MLVWSIQESGLEKDDLASTSAMIAIFRQSVAMEIIVYYADQLATFPKGYTCWLYNRVFGTKHGAVIGDRANTGVWNSDDAKKTADEFDNKLDS